jgi:hypothetical protein
MSPGILLTSADIRALKDKNVLFTMPVYLPGRVAKNPQVEFPNVAAQHLLDVGRHCRASPG